MKIKQFMNRLLSHTLIKTNFGYSHDPDCLGCKTDFWINVICVLFCIGSVGYFFYLMLSDIFIFH